MEKFHYFLYGKEFTLETDQKPLVSIYVVPLGFEDDPTAVRTFDASGEEAGQL